MKYKMKKYTVKLIFLYFFFLKLLTVKSFFRGIFLLKNVFFY